MSTNVNVVQKIDFSGAICTKFALDWSADNKIAICTDRCVYILTSTLSPVESGFPLPLHKQVIMAPTELLDFKLLKNILPLTDGPVIPAILLQTRLDRTLVPDSDMTPSYLVFRSAKWSPKGASGSGSCYLATLCQDHRLSLYQQQNEKWVALIDISETLHELHKPFWEDEEAVFARKVRNEGTPPASKSEPAVKSFISNRKVLYDEEEAIVEIAKQKRRIYSLAATGIIWTNMFNTLSSASDGSYEWCYLIAAMKSGAIVWWKVSPDDGKIATLSQEWETGLGMLTALCWQQTSGTSGFLCCGTLAGEIILIRVTIQLEGRDPKLCKKSTCMVWDQKDRLSVDHVSILKTNAKRYVIVCNKQHVMVTSEVIISDNDLCIKNIGYSEEPFSLPVTGCSVMDPVIPQSHILFSTMDNLVLKAKISYDADAVTTHFENLNITDVDLKHNMIQGLGTSPNGLLCALILKTAVWFDHLIKREPLQLVLFVTKSYDKIFSELAQILKPQVSFLQTPASSLSRYPDYLECARISLATEHPLPELFSSMLNVDKSEFESLTLNQVYFTRFLLKAMMSNLAIFASSLSKEEREAITEKLGVLEASILTKYIQSVLNSCQDKLDLLTPAQSQSLLLMGDWLYMRYETPVSLLYEAFGHECPDSVEAIPPRETCRICKLPVKLEHFHYGSCEKKHSFSRCCLSLLLCDTLPYYKCSACESLALQDVWTNKIVCTYCSLPMV